MNTDASTPLSQWVGSQAWWADTANAPNPLNHRNHFVDDDHNVSTVDSQQGVLPAVGADTWIPPQERQQQRETYRDPRRMFGDLPNSSCDARLLGDPVERELGRRAADAGSTTTAVPRHGEVERTRATAVDTRWEAGLHTAESGKQDQDPMKEECEQLRHQLASLARERDRWEYDRERLLKKDVDRSRDFEGLRRAVEAQSQLVMESLVAAQRLAPEARRKREPLYGKEASGVRPSQVQSARVHPQPHSSNLYLPVTTSVDPAGVGRREQAVAVRRPDRRELETSIGRRVMVENDTEDHQRWGAGQEMLRSPSVGQEKFKPDVTTPVFDNFQRRSSSRSDGHGGRYSSPLDMHHASPWHIMAQRDGGATSGRESSKPVFTVGNSGKLRDRAQGEDESRRIARRSGQRSALTGRPYSFPTDVVDSGSGTREPNRAARATASQSSFDSAPGTVVRSSRPGPRPVASTPAITRCHDPYSRNGWRRIYKTDGGSGVGHDDQAASSSDIEVWEWKGRRVALQKSPKQSPLLEPPIQTTGEIEAASETTPIEVASIRDEIEGAKAAVQALANAVAASARPILTASDDVASASAPVSPASIEEDTAKAWGMSPPDIGQAPSCEPKPPDSEHKRRTSASSSPLRQSSTSPRRVSFVLSTDASVVESSPQSDEPTTVTSTSNLVDTDNVGTVPSVSALVDTNSVWSVGSDEEKGDHESRNKNSPSSSDVQSVPDRQLSPGRSSLPGGIPTNDVERTKDTP